MDNNSSGIAKQVIIGLAGLAVILWLALFLPNWSLDYWQGWVYWIIFLISVLAITTYFLKKDIKLIKNRLKGGPIAEKETSQKIIQSLAGLFFILLFIASSLDHHFKWSNVPIYLVILGYVFVVLGFSIIFLVFKENSYASGIIEVGKEQKVISTGPYGVVRHPMYSGAFLMLLFTPIALGSFVGILFVIPIVLVIIWRLLDEEKFLLKNLPGYDKYYKKIQYRLVPLIW
jgi:protein-S-isoprenylcysteine O-methyltransferase Ste14